MQAKLQITCTLQWVKIDKPAILKSYDLQLSNAGNFSVQQYLNIYMYNKNIIKQARNVNKENTYSHFGMYFNFKSGIVWTDTLSNCTCMYCSI